MNFPSDTLYWWHVLEESDMLTYALSCLSDENGATSDSVGSVMTSDRRRTPPPGNNRDQLVDTIAGISRTWDKDNSLKRTANELNKMSFELQQERMAFDQQAFEKKLH